MLILKELTVSVPTYIVLKEKVLSILYLLKKDQYKSLRNRRRCKKPLFIGVIFLKSKWETLYGEK
jgi:hypothetical protein